MNRIVWIASVIGLAVLTVSGPVGAQSADTRALLDRLERLERDIRTLNVQIARGGGSGGSGSEGAAIAGGDQAYARLAVRMSQMESDLRSTTGRIEEMAFQLNQIADQLTKMSADMDFRLKQVEQGGRPLAGAQGLGQTGLGQLAPGGFQTTTQLPVQPGQQAIGVPGTPAANDLPAGSQVLGTLSESDLAAAPQQPAAPQESAAPVSEEDALLAQLTGDDPATPAAAPTPQPAAPAPASVPAPAGVNVAASPTTGALAPTQTAALPDGTPREKYMHAFGLLRQGQYDVAASALQNFITQHSDDALASNARYWLGETYYVRGAYVEAAETFLEGYQSDIQGPKAADALLKLGMSLASLNKKQEACAAFQKLRADYPDAPQGLKSTLQREWQRNGCV